MNPFKKVLFLILLAVIVFSCTSIVDPPEKDAAIYGKIVDQNDNLLTGVSIHYIFSLGEDIECRNIGISYSLTANQTVTMQIYDMNNNEVAKPLNQVSQLPGNHTLFFDGDSLTNGVYRYKVTGQSFNKESTFLLLTNDINKLVTANPVTTSDNSGEFRINYSNLGIGKEYMVQNAQRQLVVSDSIKFVLHKPGYYDLIVPARLDTAKALEKTFKMFKNN